jgi:hypothetical protein
MAARLDSASMFGTRVPAPEKSRQFGIFTHSALKTAICSEYGKFRFEELKLCTYKIFQVSPSKLLFIRQAKTFAMQTHNSRKAVRLLQQLFASPILIPYTS